jgi:hypothetical protein
MEMEICLESRAASQRDMGLSEVQAYVGDIHSVPHVTYMKTTL